MKMGCFLHHPIDINHPCQHQRDRGARRKDLCSTDWLSEKTWVVEMEKRDGYSKRKQDDLRTAYQPIKNCYWVTPGKLLAGEYPRSKDENTSILKISSLIDAGISAFVDLTEQNEGLLPYSDLIGEVLYQRFPVRDVSIPQQKKVGIGCSTMKN